MNDVPVLTLGGHGSTATITIGRGAKSNALDGDAWRLLERHLQDIGSQESIRVVVLSGHGETFCAWSGMTEWVGAASDVVAQSFSLMEAAFRAVEKCPVPVVAKITGAAAGAGCQLALACDLRIMAASARIGMPIARLGILPSPTFAARMVELAGPSVARELLYTGRLLDAPAAVAAGLADRWVTDDRLTEETDRLAKQIAVQPPAAIRAAKQAVATMLRQGGWQEDRPARGVRSGLPAGRHRVSASILTGCRNCRWGRAESTACCSS